MVWLTSGLVSPLSHKWETYFCCWFYHYYINWQDPVLFPGTLRINLDPFDTCTDDDIWMALKTAHMSEFVEGLNEGLEYSVAEGGVNLRCSISVLNDIIVSCF